MSILKKLAGQTMWYGMSNIAARLLTYLLTPYFTYTLVTEAGQQQYGEYSYIYSLFPVMNVLFTYGMETTFFRFSRDEEWSGKLYSTQLGMILLSTLVLCGLLIIFKEPAAQLAEIEGRSYYIIWCAGILAMDTLATLPFARLRQENRPRKYAFIKIAGIIAFVGLIVLLFSWGEELKSLLGKSFSHWYDKHWGLGFILFANLIQCALSLILLFNEWKDVRLRINKALAQKVVVYGFPILIAGFGGVMNDSLNRLMYMKIYPASSEVLDRELGIFSATVRLSVMITLAIQAFKLAAEPFFFSISKEKDARKSYAKVMLWFCICLALMFLNITLFIDVWKLFIGPEYREALYLTPILLLANIFLGIYYNLSIWYKLSDQTRFGAYIMLTGAAITLVFNYFMIPPLGYAACAYSMLLSYGVMMILSYLLGQKHYAVPYEVKKIGSYFLLMLLLFLLQTLVMQFVHNVPLRIVTGAIGFLSFLLIVWKRERMVLQQIIRR